MKVALVAPPIMDYVGRTLRPIAMDAVRECPPYGVYLLAAVLRSAGHEVALVDLILEGTCSVRAHAETLSGCDLVGVSATSMSWPSAVQVVRQVRRLRRDLPIVAGGIHPTMFDRHVLSTFPVDYVVRGEGERALPALCRALESGRDVSGVPGLTWRAADGTIVRNPLGPPLRCEELGAFPLPDYGALPEGAYTGLAIESSRGCAFDCSFCCTSYRRTWRDMPPAVFVERLERVLEHAPRTASGTIHVVDDEFSTNPRRAMEIARRIGAAGLGTSLVYDSRASDLLHDGYVEAMAPVTYRFLVGAECGYDEGLRRAGKGTTCRALEDAAALLARHGIADRADFSFILGLPWETKADVERTIRFAMHLLGRYGVKVLLQWYCQIPGSRLWDEAREAGSVSEAMYDDFGFFRNLYLFRSGVRLAPDEIWDVGDLMSKLLWVLKRARPDQEMAQYAFPDPIAASFPRASLLDAGAGLANLREVSAAARAT